ncbi:MAG: ThiF family adenylyltransferase [Planctomycetes bacterium]|nr:ThiF family adenylyltransferase [Planctomycetota bacterium]
MSQDSGRYSRQILFPGIGAAGQSAIRSATVGLVGLGALGSGIADLLVRAGVGRLRAVDRDYVDLSNLHRQGLYTESDARERLPKAVAAGRRLALLDPEVEVEARVADLRPENAEDLLGDCDLILDGTDGFETRYLINDLAVKRGLPWIYGACVAAQGMTANILPGDTPCLACLFPDPPPPGTGDTCDTAGIIGPAASLIASLQVTEALKILVGDRKALRRGLLSIELWPYRAVELGGRSARPRADCRVCGERHFDFLEGDRWSRTVTLCGRDSVQVLPRDPGQVDLGALAARLAGQGDIRHNDFLLVFASQEVEITVFRDGRAIVKGCTDGAEARRLYQRYVGA